MKRTSSHATLPALLAGALLAAACDPPPPASTQPAPSAPAPTVPSLPAPSGPIPGPWASALGPVETGIPPAPSEAAPTPYAPGREVAGAAHILIAYQGAAGAAPTVTRSKDEAKKLATALRERLIEDTGTFEELVKKHTDDSLSRDTGGAVGTFERYAMPAAFADATFAMPVGSISEVIETPRGFHVIRRTR